MTNHSQQKRSFVARKLVGLAGDKSILPVMSLIDLSLTARLGIKGSGTSAWLTSLDVSLPVNTNQASRQQSGDIALRLGPEEILILGSLKRESNLCTSLEASRKDNAARVRRGYLIPRMDSHCWFLVTGDCAADMFAKICAVDLRRHKFNDLQVAQCHLANLAAILLRDDQFSFPAYHLLADSAAAEYLWDCLVDAMIEFHGQPRALEALL